VVLFTLGVGASAGPIDRAAVVARHNVKFVLGKAAEQHDTAAEPQQQTYWCVRFRARFSVLCPALDNSRAPVDALKTTQTPLKYTRLRATHGNTMFLGPHATTAWTAFRPSVTERLASP
jgi:hypothetical protein